MDVSADTFTIEEYIERPHCFTSRDVLNWHAGEQLRYSDIFNKLNDGHLFIKVIDGPLDIYISKKSLYRWLVRLNSRLARSKEAKLKIPKFRSVLNELQLDNRRWSIVPQEYPKFGQKFGLIYYWGQVTQVIVSDPLPWGLACSQDICIWTPLYLPRPPVMAKWRTPPIA